MKRFNRNVKLGLVLLCLLSAPAAHADLISPNDKNSAIKVTLPLPADQYFDFSLTLDGRNVKVGETLSIDPIKCLNFTTEIKVLKITNRTKYCGDFKAGELTEIPISAIQFSSPPLHSDTLMRETPYNYRVSDSSGNGLSVQRFAHDFAFPKLIPFLTDSAVANVSMSDVSSRVITLPLDPATKVFRFENPNAERPNMTFQHMGTKVFPDSQPLTIDFSRRLNVPSGFGAKLRKRVVIDQNVHTLTWLKMYWDEYDELCMSQLNSRGACVAVYSMGGTSGPGKEESANYPTMINVYRIDVDDVSVHSEDGQTKTAPGTYFVEKLESPTTALEIGGGLHTKTGLDVLPGTYRVTVFYKDPFTGLNESKIYNLTFK